MMPGRSPAFSNVLYVTNASTDRWFIPSEGPEINTTTPSDGLNLEKTMADQLDQCKAMVGKTSDGTQIGKAVKSGTLANWS